MVRDEKGTQTSNIREDKKAFNHILSLSFTFIALVIS